MKLEKDITDRMLMGQSSLQSGDEEPQVFDVYQLVPDLPNSTKKREVCFDHIEQGAATELMGDFDLGGVHFPERDEPQEIITQLSCKGVSCVLKKCGLTVEQFDTNGSKQGKMRLSQ
ncbi:MAG: hypothetical protein JWN28_180 [Candidatus Saccharibacteria bacterium]|nr:hypothetical protein [Candidatus Saccharibacteria bacterium]